MGLKFLPERVQTVRKMVAGCKYHLNENTGSKKIRNIIQQ